jgi:hypothetical protein
MVTDEISHPHEKENLTFYIFVGNYCRVNNESFRPAPNNYNAFLLEH